MLNILLAIVVSAAIDSTTIFLGDQTDMHLQATVEAGTPLQMPVYGETLIPEIEIVDRQLKTVLKNHKRRKPVTASMKKLVRNLTLFTGSSLV